MEWVGVQAFGPDVGSQLDSLAPVLINVPLVVTVSCGFSVFVLPAHCIREAD